MSIADALSGLFNKASSLSGISPSYYSRLSTIESSNNPYAQNSSSSAGGLFQFIDSTWNQWGSGSKLGTGDNVASGIAGLTKSNFNVLKKALGREPTQGELYLAHQQGAGGAVALLSNPNASATEVVGYDAVINNGGTAGMSAGDFASLWTNKFGGGSATGGGSFLGNLGAMLNPGTYIGAAAGVDTGETEAAKIVAGSAEKTQQGWFDFLEQGAIRFVVVILGFIFVAVGLALFKPGVVVNAVPAARAIKGVVK